MLKNRISVLALAVALTLCSCSGTGGSNDDGVGLAVVDNGVGISKEDIQKLYERINSHTARNIGLTNLNRRLILHYGPEYGLRIRSKLGLGTELSFVIPKVDPKTVRPINNDTKN